MEALTIVIKKKRNKNNPGWKEVKHTVCRCYDTLYWKGKQLILKATIHNKDKTVIIMYASNYDIAANF